MRIQTPGCAVARCEFSNDLGTWPVERTPGSAVVRVSREPLRVSCRFEGSSGGGVDAKSSRPATSGVGGLVGGVVGGTAAGVALGGTAMAFIPPLGVIAVLAGAGVGAVAGNAAESQGRSLRYPDLVSLPMACGASSADMPPVLGLTLRGSSLAEAQTLGLTVRTAALAVAVLAGGLADSAGLRVGDAILALNGHEVGDPADFEERMLAEPVNAPLALRIWRAQQVVEVVLVRRSKATP